MSATDPIMVKYGTLCDVADEIIGAEKLLRNGGKVTPVVESMYTGERNAMARALAMVTAGRYGGERYSAAFQYVWQAVMSAEELPASGDVVIGLRKHLDGVTA